MKYILAIGLIISVLLLMYCRSTTIAGGLQAVSGFEKERYLGKWYEIARFDFRFERGLNNTTAEYSLNADGTIKVVNRGYDIAKRKWRKAVGKAKFVGSEQTAMLRVSFFGPFYSGYNVIALDKDYRYALVAGKNLDYLWILSREKTIPNNFRESYVKFAQERGFDTSKLIWIEHQE
ncbi:lipocalin family protein [Alistipes sp. ZOR0009]|jgi:apolipoprotein D and lipocalin family protein|uniref:lipocalin family protein n=1 Tax=Alistipes sp. ZOR0009 TaxID=1339253 RepID=UPI00064664B1|nr:lipocalin family protein [Alistipes sp. ZOR0009]